MIKHTTTKCAAEDLKKYGNALDKVYQCVFARGWSAHVLFFPGAIEVSRCEDQRDQQNYS
jgi:hypothetical protein